MRSGELDRAYDLLKSPTLFPAASSASMEASAWGGVDDNFVPGGLQKREEIEEGMGEGGSGGAGEVGIEKEMAVGHLGEEAGVAGVPAPLEAGTTAAAATAAAAAAIVASRPGSVDGVPGGGRGEEGSDARGGAVDPVAAGNVAETTGEGVDSAGVDSAGGGGVEGGGSYYGGRVGGQWGVKGQVGEREGDGERRTAGAGAAAAAGGGVGEEGGVLLARPSVQAFTSVLTGFAGVGDKDRALAVFQQVMGSLSAAPAAGACSTYVLVSMHAKGLRVLPSWVSINLIPREVPAITELFAPSPIKHTKKWPLEDVTGKEQRLDRPYVRACKHAC